MSIKNGNSNFNLTASQVVGQKRIRVSFKRGISGGEPIKLECRAPHGQFHDTENFYNTPDDEYIHHDFYVPAFGEYKIHISTNRGYSYDWLIVNVGISGTLVDEYTFTDADVQKVATQELVLNFILLAGGFMARYNIAAGAFSASLYLLNWFTAKDKFDNSIDVISGWKVRVEMYQSGKTIYIVTKQYDRNGNLQKTLNSQTPIDTF